MVDMQLCMTVYYCMDRSILFINAIKSELYIYIYIYRECISLHIKQKIKNQNILYIYIYIYIYTLRCAYFHMYADCKAIICKLISQAMARELNVSLLWHWVRVR